MLMKSFIALAVAGILLAALVIYVYPVEAKRYTVYVRAHLDKICDGDELYFRMTDNTKDPKTGEHKLLIWKTPYFEATKTDYKWKVSVDSKKVPTGVLRTYDEVERNGVEIHDEYQRMKLANGISFNFVVPELC